MDSQGFSSMNLSTPEIGHSSLTFIFKRQFFGYDKQLVSCIESCENQVNIM